MNNPCNNGGFTLVELLVVIGIIAALAGLLLPTISYVRTRADKNETIARIEVLKSALSHYETEFGDYPPSSLSQMGIPTNGQADGIESLLRVLSTQIGTGPYYEPDTDHLRNVDSDRLLNDFNRSYMGSLELFELIDPWGSPLVYLHNRDYDNPQRSGRYLQFELDQLTVIQAARDETIQSYHGYQQYQIWSFGPDGENNNGTGDDITSW